MSLDKNKEMYKKEVMDSDAIVSKLPIMFKQLNEATNAYNKEVMGFENPMVEQDYFDIRQEFRNIIKLISNDYIGEMINKFNICMKSVQENLESDELSTSDIALLSFIIGLSKNNIDALDNFNVDEKNSENNIGRCK